MNRFVNIIIQLVLTLIIAFIFSYIITPIINPYINLWFPDKCISKIENGLVISNGCNSYVSLPIFLSDLGVLVIVFICAFVLSGIFIKKMGKK